MSDHPTAPKPAGSYPRHPTTGWMRSELQRLGYSVRGKDMSDEQLARMFRQLGYDVSHEPAPAPVASRGSPER